jgi:positive regulator of sigma E activity
MTVERYTGHTGLYQAIIFSQTKGCSGLHSSYSCNTENLTSIGDRCDGTCALRSAQRVTVGLRERIYILESPRYERRRKPHRIHFVAAPLINIRR